MSGIGHTLECRLACIDFKSQVMLASCFRSLTRVSASATSHRLVEQKVYMQLSRHSLLVSRPRLEIWTLGVGTAAQHYEGSKGQKALSRASDTQA